MASTLSFKKDERDSLLIVEGKNDCHIIMALCKAHKVPQTFDIFDSGSNDKAMKKFSALILAADKKKVLGLVLDADDNLKGRWQSLKDKLEKQGIKLPATPDKDGTIIPASNLQPTLGFWLMPDNQKHGMIEDFCCEIAETTSLEYAQECVNKAKDKKLSSFKDRHQKKAEIHTYLAWQDEPGMPIGQAITAKILDAKHPLAQDFSDWLKALFKV